MFAYLEIQWKRLIFLGNISKKNKNPRSLCLYYLETLIFRNTHSPQAEKCKKWTARYLCKIGLKAGVTWLIISEVSKLICHKHRPLLAPAGSSDSAGLNDT